MKKLLILLLFFPLNLYAAEFNAAEMCKVLSLSHTIKSSRDAHLKEKLFYYEEVINRGTRQEYYLVEKQGFLMWDLYDKKTDYTVPIMESMIIRTHTFDVDNQSFFSLRSIIHW